MRIFYDTEFVERGPMIPIQPISIGMVAEDGRELYLVNEECLSNVMNHGWLSVNVAPSLPISNDQRGTGHFITQWDPEHQDYGYVTSLDGLREQVHEFLTQFEEPIELWAYYGAYDHVVLCQLFGAMSELPPGIPMFSHELMQLMEQFPNAKIPTDAAVPHHALYDARWNRDVYELLSTMEYHPFNRSISEGS